MTSLKARYVPAPAAAKIFNGTLFNLSWLAIVLSHSPVIAPMVVALHLFVHFGLIGRGEREVRLIAVTFLLGAVLDQLLFLTGVFTVDGQAALAPFWLTCLWPVLATTFLHVFESFRSRPLLAALFGAIGGTGSYIAGTGLSDVAFAHPVAGPLVMAVLWAGLFPLLLRLAGRIAEDR